MSSITLMVGAFIMKETHLRTRFVSKKILFFTFFTLVTIEAVLNFSGKLINHRQIVKNTEFDSHKYDLKILVLGESTSAHFKKHGSWVSVFEKKINQKKIHTKVFNVARIATTTTFILKRLPEQISLYRPDIVISMMGVNDNNKFWLKELETSTVLDHLKNLRLVKAAAWVLNIKFSYGKFIYTDQMHPLYPDDFNIKEASQIIKLIGSNGLIPHKEKIESLLVSFSEEQKAQYYAALAMEFLPKWGLEKNKYDNALALYRETIKYSQNFVFAFDIYLLLLKMNGLYDECLQASKIADKRKFTPNDVILSRFASCAENNKNQKYWEQYFHKYGFEFSSLEQYEQTKFNYNKITQLLNKKKIFHIAMQYPLKSLDTLKMYFDKNNKPDLFIGNIENFQNAILKYGTESIFTDMFAGTFGHTSKKGNDLLAEQALKAVLQIYKKDRITPSR